MRLLSLLCSSHKTSHFSPVKVSNSLTNVTAKVSEPAETPKRLRRPTPQWSDSKSLSKCYRWRKAFPLAFISDLTSAWQMITYQKVFPLCKFHRIREAGIEGEWGFLWLKSLICRKESFLGIKCQESQKASFVLRLYPRYLRRIFNRPVVWKP